MSYVVIARRWRPQQFEEIIGQEHVSKTLSNAIANERIAHSYIFTGPRGVGKTTTARILAKALNCEQGPTPTPCNECASCKAITLGNSLDVLEIDGASNRGIDEIRNLRENIRYTPTQGKYKIYIIDEVHMLTKEAFNALLKTLEEPPEHALFIFATTEIHKVPATILSRCQRFDFRRIPLKTIMEHLNRICAKDKIEVEEEALLQIAKKADGSMRDSQSILDQIISYSGTKVTFADVAQALGVIHQDIYFKITGFVKESNIKELILQAKEVFDSGYDVNEFLLGLEEHFRNLLIVRSTGSTEFLDVAENYVERYKEVADGFSEGDLIGYLQTVAETMQQLKTSQQPNLKFELGLIKLAKQPATVQIEDILEKLNALKKKAPEAELTEEPELPEPPMAVEEQTALSPAALQEIWPRFLEEINQIRPTLVPILEQVRPDLDADETVRLDFGAINPFQKKLLEHNKPLLNQTLEQLLERALRISCLFTVVESTQPKQSQAEKNRTKEEIMKQIREQGGEVISKLIDDFDLEPM